MYCKLKHMLNTVLNSRHFYKVFVAVIVANLASLFIVYQNIEQFIENQAPNFSNLGYGESLDDAVQSGLYHQNVKINTNNVHVVVFIDFREERYKKILSYLDLMRKRHLETGVKFDIIVPVSEARVKETKSLLSLELKLTSDTQGFIYDLLDIRHGDSGIVVISKKRTIQFVLSPLPPEETIRQVIEVSLYDKSISVSDLDQRGRVTQKTLKDLNVYDVVSGEHTTLQDGSTSGSILITIFDGYCPNCVAYEQRLKTLEQISSMNSDITELVFVFKFSVSEYELLELETLGIPVPVRIYQTNTVLLTELEYIGRQEATKHFRTVLVDSEYNIMYFEDSVVKDEQLIRQCNEAIIHGGAL